MAATRPREATPPPVIGKVGRYTVFITPPPGSPNPSVSPRTPTSSASSPRQNTSVSPIKMPPLQEKASLSPSPSPAAPPVQVPPQQLEKGVKGSGSVAFGFFWDAIARIQDAHSSLDDYLADWFGLNQSKYQWALNDYYENTGKEMEGTVKDAKKELVSKGQTV